MVARVLFAFGALLLGASALVGFSTSGADFTHTTQTGATASAAADWSTPSVTVSVLEPGIFGTVTVTATVTDDRSDIGHVVLEYSLAGSSTWVPLTTGCSADSGSSPLVYSCQWDTTTVDDGDYEVRATASDTATPIAFTAVSAAVPTQVANDASVVLATIPSPTKGAITLSGTLLNAGNGSRSIRFEFSPAGSGTWQNATGCAVGNTSEYTCWFNTAGLNGLYDVRAVGARGGTPFEDVQADVLIDNTAPTASLTVPAGVLSGSVQLAVTASDAHSSVPSVVIEYKRQGDAEWTLCGAPTGAPYACSLDSTSVPDGTYDFRATATDAAGNTSPASTQTREINNTAGTVELTLPSTGATVSGNAVAVAASANSPRGVASVTLQYRSGSTGAFLEICPADSSLPYTCSWDVSALSNGAYQLRAVLIEAYGTGVVTSATVGVTVNNALGSVVITSPTAGGTVSGTVAIAATAQPASGKTIQSVTFQGPGGDLQPLCAPDADAPYTCSWVSTAVAYDASYQLRAVLTHSDGTKVSATIVVKVDNVVGSTTSPTPTANTRLSGVTSLGTTVTSNAAASSVRIIATRTRPTGPATLSIPCVAGAGVPPLSVTYACSWDTSAIANADYTLRSEATLANGSVVLSPLPQSTVRVRNLRGQDVQAVVGSSGNHAGKVGSGDQLLLTFSDVVSLTTVRTGWTGATTGDLPVTWTNNAAGDVLSFGTSANLGSVTFGQNYVNANYTAATVTMTASTVTGADGVDVTRILLTFKVTSNPTAFSVDTTAGAMVWRPSAAVTDGAVPTPVASSITPVTESGSVDSEF